MESSRGSSSKAQSRHCRNIRLEEQNHDYRRNYLPFTIPSSFYNIVHVHRFTTNDTISTLINHFESCYRYSIDTESDRFTYDLSLIQVHSIPQHLPSFIVLFEINHLPPSDSSLMGKIKLLFSLLFRLGNIIFSWGSMSDELKSAIQMNLFTWPVSALCINLQDEFPGWYRRALPPCEACGSIQSSNKAMSSKSRCICTSNFPYVKSTDKWSLQNAIRYTVNRFLDKSSTKKNWNIMLDPNYSPLSSYERCKRINYAIYDCFAVTLLHQAIYDKWTLTQLREAELISLFTSNAPPHSSSLSSSTLLENISEDENETKSTSLSISNALLRSSLPLSNLLEDISDDEGEDDEVFISSLSRHHDTDQLVNTTRHVDVFSTAIPENDVIELIPSDQELSSNELPQPRRKCRSTTARIRRNRKRNMVKRSYRDRHIIYRNVYHRFTLKQIKNILRDRDVRYVHPKLDKSSRILSIGMKKSSLVDLYFDRIPGDLFDKFHYQQYRRQEH
ncbi:unnamed protein product [Rotaria sordida]|uniref:Uncharacterized protein n=2 Tax=Rotaria sordida TaxID=392033 RepID=A0A816D3H1_9BILA|nr:unnamed protein product [Rotaria sordida]CAF1629498.1 unnamed protein product [Rotaria sordida]